ncbi:MAG TPA: MopE-related protein [Myxococcota bacterium]|nr:MopE-related protein [Myxococcota bacterium]
MRRGPDRAPRPRGPPVADNDLDGVCAPADCDDGDARIHPGAPDIVADAIDEDCDGVELCYRDNDDDGYGSTATVGSADLDCGDPGEATMSTDCHDANPQIHPGAIEVPADGLDGDCDGQELCYVDADLDGYGAAQLTRTVDLTCSSPGHAPSNNDCDDDAEPVHPGGQEVCDVNVTDEDCDGLADDLDPSAVGQGPLYRDADADGHGDPNVGRLGCHPSQGQVTLGDDCDDSDPLVWATCSATCGDGILDPNEACDDGARDLGDGCSDQCAVEPLLFVVTPGRAGAQNVLHALDAPGGAPISFLVGPPGVGATAVPGCPGLTVPLGPPRTTLTATTNAAGYASRTLVIPAGQAGRTYKLAAVDASTCRVSAVITRTF